MKKEFYLFIEGNGFRLKSSREYVDWVRRLNRKVGESGFDGNTECQLEGCVKKKRKTFISVEREYILESWIGGVDEPTRIELCIYVDLKEGKK